MQDVLLVIHLMVALALIGVVLMQRSAQDGGGLMGGGGGGTMGGLFSARGSANLLTRTTAILATLFIVLSLAQGIIAGQQHTARSLAEQLTDPAATTTAPAVADTTQEAPKVDKAPAAPAVPVSK